MENLTEAEEKERREAINREAAMATRVAFLKAEEQIRQMNLARGLRVLKAVYPKIYKSLFSGC